MGDCTILLFLSDRSATGDHTERGARIVVKDDAVTIEHMGDERGPHETPRLDPATVNALRWVLIDRA